MGGLVAKIDNVKIPDSVTTISNYAFNEAHGLKSTDIQSSVTY